VNEVSPQLAKSSNLLPNKSVGGRDLQASIIVIAAALLLFGAAMSRSFYDGRMASPITHDDVNYFIIGIQRIQLLRGQGFHALFEHFMHYTEHSPFLTYQATLAYLLFGITDWAPYASNIFLLTAFLAVSAHLLRNTPPALLTACLLTLIAFPASSDIIVEFSPEIVCSLFTAIGVVLTLRLPLFDAPFGARFRAGLCFGLGFFAHPVASAFTFIALLATLTWIFLRDVFFAAEKRNLAVAGRRLALILLFSLWLPLLYMAPRYQIYWEYFDRTILNPVTRSMWVPNISLRQHLTFYLFGPGGRFMFGNRLLGCLVIIGAGCAAAWWRHDSRSLLRQAELLLLAMVFWFVPTLSPVKTEQYAFCFGFTIAFLTILGMRSIYETFPRRFGILAVWAIACLFLISDVSHYPVPNTPRTLVDRTFAFQTLNRLKAVLFGNATSYHGTKVYQTNIGAYAPNILQYYMLKQDPALDWDFASKWQSPDPEVQLKFIHASQEDFVIASARDNGLTYSPFAEPAEDAVLAAMWRDQQYVAIDRFYGPNGRTVTVFQRRGKFVGWRPVSGIGNPSGTPDGTRLSTGGVAYLQAYAPRSVNAELQMKYSGSPGEVVGIFLNQKALSKTTLPPTGSASLVQTVPLNAGENDIIVQYPSAGKLMLEQLLIVPQIADES